MTADRFPKAQRSRNAKMPVTPAILQMDHEAETMKLSLTVVPPHATTLV